MFRTTRWGPHAGRAGALVLLLLLAGHSVVVAAAKSKASEPLTEASVVATETARREALLKADTTALSRITAPEFVEISRLGMLRTKADNMREIGSGDLKLTTVKYDSLSVRIYGQVALLRGIADNTGTYRGFPFSGKIWYTRVFVWRDGRWQAVAMQHTPIP